MSAPLLRTYTGRKVDPFHVTHEDVDARDIAQALSGICRYGGHTRWHYSVARHSVVLCEALRLEGHDREIQRIALLHDAAETWLGDITAPVKRIIAGPGSAYARAESRAQRAVWEAFGLDPLVRELEIVDAADKAVVEHELDVYQRSTPLDVVIERYPAARLFARDATRANDAALFMRAALQLDLDQESP